MTRLLCASLLASLAICPAASTPLAPRLYAYGYSGKACNGELVYHSQLIRNTCYEPKAEQVAQVESILLSGHFESDLSVHFWKNGDCTVKTVARTRQPECYIIKEGATIGSIGYAQYK